MTKRKGLNRFLKRSKPRPSARHDEQEFGPSPVLPDLGTVIQAESPWQAPESRQRPPDGYVCCYATPTGLVPGQRWPSLATARYKSKHGLYPCMAILHVRLKKVVDKRR